MTDIIISVGRTNMQITFLFDIIESITYHPFNKTCGKTFCFTTCSVLYLIFFYFAASTFDIPSQNCSGVIFFPKSSAIRFLCVSEEEAGSTLSQQVI